MAFSTSPSRAGEAAKALVGQWAHLKVDQPDVFIRTVAAVLAQYPLGIVEECVDPRTGPVNKFEFLTIAKLRPWLDARLEYHQALAAYRPRPVLPAPPRVDITPEQRQTMIAKFAALLARLGRKGDIISRRKRVNRWLDQRQLRRDKARALAEAAAE